MPKAEAGQSGGLERKGVHGEQEGWGESGQKAVTARLGKSGFSAEGS